MNTPKKSNLVPLVDMDIIVYRCGFADSSQTEPLEHTLHSVKLFLNNIYDVFETRGYGFLQGKGNYREYLYTIQPYKGNRDPTKRPVYFAEIREYLQGYYGAELVTGRETDDKLGCLQYASKDRSTCIVTIDKDLDCIPGWHYNPVKRNMYYVTKYAADRKFWTQVLSGDITDNIRGIPNIGKKKAEKIIHDKLIDWGEMRTIVENKYKSTIGEDWYKHFYETALAVWIQREDWIGFDGKKISEQGPQESND